MMAVIFKALLIYFLFLFVRSVWRGYRMVEEIKSRSAEYSQADPFQTRSNPSQSKQGGDVLEAEYRVLDKEGDQ
jgi:hypothetical protein